MQKVKPATLKDIATKLGVSVTTISKSLYDHPDISVEMRKQVRDLAQEMEYVPSAFGQNLRRSHSNFVSLIVSDIANPYYGRVIRGVQQTLEKEGYFTLISSNYEDPVVELRLLNELRSLNVRGVIITPAAGNTEGVNLINKLGITYVLAHRYIEQGCDNYVVADDFQSAYMATDHLLQRRKQKVIFLNGKLQISSAQERKRGYLKALEEHGISMEQDWLEFGAVTQEDGYQRTQDILKNNKLPFSLLCFSDYVASGAVKALLDNNISIPDQVAVMGIDDIELLSYAYPALSTVHLPKMELGVSAARLLVELMRNEGEATQNHITLPTRLVIRDST